MTCSLARKGRPSPAAVYDEPSLAKVVAAAAGPAAAQVRCAAGCPVNDRESPWVTLLTGPWRARPGPSSSPATGRVQALGVRAAKGRAA
jgi:hypothetical protein